MKISLKIFIFTYCIMMVVTILGGFFLIHYEYQDSLEQARRVALEDNDTLYTYVAAIEETIGSGSAEYSMKRFLEQMSKGDENNILIGDYEEVQEYISLNQAESLEHGQYSYFIIENEGEVLIQVVSKYYSKYILNHYNITGIIERRNQNYELYRQVIIAASVVIAAVLYLFSWYITRPLSKVTKMAGQISAGDYTVRIDSSYKNMKSYEVEQLGNTLNHLAANTESYIEKLKGEAQKKEDFMGNFTHEMKTPMTSIIGYADLLRTFDLNPEQRREYSNYIYHEGKRVEQLALNLLHLIVMEKTDFQLEHISVRELWKQLEKEVSFLADKYCVNVHFEYEEGDVLGEKTLLLIAIKNLIDNACKASEKQTDVWLQGKRFGEKYQILVKDCGRGIPESEMNHILEPFYMVDKSRARSQGGAGLGLSLCHKIIQIHGGEMQISSELQKGTSVTLLLNMHEKGGGTNEEIPENG